MTASTDRAPGRDWKAFGWQGINLTVPADWELVATSGSYESGYVGLADESSMRLELRWESAPGSFEPSDLASRYLQELRRKARKDSAEITVRRDTGLASPKRKQVECYEWASSVQGAGMVSRCEDCGRMVHLAVLGLPGQSLRGLVRTVFASLRDHPEADTHLWRFFDLEFRSPRELPLRRQDLKTGCIRLLFGRGRRELEFVRVSLAKVLLARQSLPAWFQEFYAASLKRCRYTLAEGEVKGHPALRLQGAPWWILNPLRWLGRGLTIQGACWHCAPSNRLFIVRHVAPRSESGILEQAINSLSCCPGS